jgi:hypothetical protein
MRVAIWGKGHQLQAVRSSQDRDIPGAALTAMARVHAQQRAGVGEIRPAERNSEQQSTRDPSQDPS